MLPEANSFISQSDRVPSAADCPVLVTVGRDCTPARDSAFVITGQALVLVLVTVDKQGNVAEIAGHVLDFCAVDQFLPLQHAAEQQADDDEYNGNFYQRETRLLSVHFILPTMTIVIANNEHIPCQRFTPCFPCFRDKTVHFSTHQLIKTRNFAKNMLFSTGMLLADLRA